MSASCSSPLAGMRESGIKMSFEFLAENDILVMTLHGKYTYEDSLPIREQSVQLMHKHKLRLILVDLRDAYLDFSTYEFFEFCISFQQRFPPDTRHAVVYSTRYDDVSNLAFAENVSRNRGIILKIFTDVDEARAWLRSGIAANT